MNRNRRDQAHAKFGKEWRYRITSNPTDTITRWAQGLGIAMDTWQQSFLQMLHRLGSLENAAMALRQQPRRYTGGRMGTAVTPPGAYCPCGTPYVQAGALCRNCCHTEDQ